VTPKDRIRDWLPPAIYRPAVRWFREHRSIMADEQRLLVRNARIRGMHANQKCFVLANGPSLQNLDLARLGLHPTIVMNHFNQHPAFGVWQPTFHCVAEPAERYENEVGQKSLDRMLAGYTTTTHLFPVGARAYLLGRGLPQDRLVFFRSDGRPASDFNAIDFTRAVPAPHDTSILSISLAIALGCSPIVLLGLDYDWLSHRSVNHHFYDDRSMPWEPEDMSKTSYLALMRHNIASWAAHGELRRIAEATGQVILNANPDSFLDAYDFIAPEEALAPS
jgi:hypothetical protein